MSRRVTPARGFACTRRFLNNNSIQKIAPGFVQKKNSRCARITRAVTVSSSFIFSVYKIRTPVRTKIGNQLTSSLSFFASFFFVVYIWKVEENSSHCLLGVTVIRRFSSSFRLFREKYNETKDVKVEPGIFQIQ